MKRLMVALLVYSFGNAAREDVSEPWKKGNLSLSASQQPSPLFAFGQNIVDAHDAVGYGAMYYGKGKNKNFVDIWPSILYGLRNDLSLYFVAPFTPKNQINGHSSSGLEDIFIQAEYLFYNKSFPESVTQATVVGALFLPTGSTKKNPSLGAGAPSFLLGTTLSCTAVDWYWFLSPFVFLTTSKNNTKFGNQFFYQAGLGKNIMGKPDELIVAGIIELYGLYSQRDRIKGVLASNTGGNVVYIGPELYVATKQLIAQIGLLYAVCQHAHGCQKKDRYIFSVSLGWKFTC